jgi:hypothetical protein
MRGWACAFTDESNASQGSQERKVMEKKLIDLATICICALIVFTGRADGISIPLGDSGWEMIAHPGLQSVGLPVVDIRQNREKLGAAPVSMLSYCRGSILAFAVPGSGDEPRLNA